MVPSAYVPFFTASMGAAATLLGLLFVAVSIAPQRTVGVKAPVERQMVADSVFTAFINAFFVSMGGAIPDINLGSIALPLSILALVQTLHVGRKLWPRPFAMASLSRRLGLVLVSLIIYGLELRIALELLGAPPQPVPVVVGLIMVLFAVYGVAILRSWELLGARRGFPGIFVNLSPLFESDRDDDARSADAAAPLAPHALPDDSGTDSPHRD